MYNSLPWIIAAVSGLALLAMLGGWLWRRPAPKARPLPTAWALAARPVFSADERRLFRLLREALPHHVVLCKLPLVRFCQPTEAREVRFWYDLLGGVSVNFAICSPNGRVLAAVDLDHGRDSATRSLQIKQSVLTACRVRYLRCTIDSLPSTAELQLLVPFSNSSARAPQSAAQRPAPAPMAASRRYGRPALWQDSAMFQDSFFSPDSRYDSYTGMEPMRSEFGAERSAADRPVPERYPDSDAPHDIVGVVVDTPRYRQR